MLEKRYQDWMDEFMNSWKELNWKRTLNTLDKNVKYYENPLDPPCKDFIEVTNLWNVVADNQKDINYQYKILSYTDELCIINWQMTRTLIPSNIRQQIDGIFQISVNEEGKCTYFKQWRYTR